MQAISPQQRGNIPSLTIVVPCYNEEEVFSFCLSELKSLLENSIQAKKISAQSHILFVDDGSRDGTWSLIEQAAQADNLVHGVKLSRNRGHQIALMAGLSCVDTDICVSIDADLQDDIGCIPQMVEKYMEGNEIVYGVRADRSSDSFFKRWTANSFYKLMETMGIQQVANHADFRLLSRRALHSLLQFEEQNIYLRGMVPLLGYKTAQVFYARKERLAGESKYPFYKMLSLAIEGITSLTIKPLRFISILGAVTCFFSIIISILVIIQRFNGYVFPGWASVEISIFFLGGVQLLCLGVIGEYIGKIYMETKHRPKFFIQEKI
ncbi:glycosyltransferase [Acetobacter lambici]|uniref:Glycosyltransferase family 2 protein n=1 Tax=Acetobacter lambici TaxID=1332824 RepID=A0ABT1EYY3_9PROT|nr:glycosyltransferase family 2 protein [Acetobacter lambici]MCP1242155.1 glycosyltransferase family 2 protein [Acetobacter lambici]MCP1258161.1 glycosyltransferase family 2 protein [Acetobacter lambici]NHO56051.1 glycosyltransferase [Acetobacter lambici]